jgi:hypothetical protein
MCRAGVPALPVTVPRSVLGAGFASDQCPEGFVAVVKSTLRILAVENVGDAFNTQVWAARRGRQACGGPAVGR